MAADWRPVYLVVYDPTGALTIAECEGHPISGTTDWAVNTRGAECHSRLIEVVAKEHVCLEQAAAEQRLRELREKRQ